MHLKKEGGGNESDKMSEEESVEMNMEFEGIDFDVEELSNSYSDFEESEDEEVVVPKKKEKKKKSKKDAIYEEKVVFADGNKVHIPNSFEDMNLSPPLIRALNKMGYIRPTPIQAATIPSAMAGRDVSGSAVTGSGKTAAYLLPTLERLMYINRRAAKFIHVVILSPTRELSMQIYEVTKQLVEFTDINVSLIVGGMSAKEQHMQLRGQPDILIATPGRLIDHLRNVQSFSIDNIDVLVLDEADRLLELGFDLELEEIIRYCPEQRQTLLFSATMTEAVEKLSKLSLRKPIRIRVDDFDRVATSISQEFVVLHQGQLRDRNAILYELLTEYYKKNVLVFCASKWEAHKLMVTLTMMGLKVGELHGDLSQKQRQSALEAFKMGVTSALIATDIASRGLDIKGIRTVINYSMPSTFERYVHRVGRTGRWGKRGVAVGLVRPQDKKVVQQIVQTSSGQIKRRILDVGNVRSHLKALEEIQGDVKERIKAEGQQKQISQVEMELKAVSNRLEHEQEIHSQPKKTWFLSEKQKKAAKMESKELYFGTQGESAVIKRSEKRAIVKAKRGKGGAKKRDKLDKEVAGKIGLPLESLQNSVQASVRIAKGRKRKLENEGVKVVEKRMKTGSARVKSFSGNREKKIASKSQFTKKNKNKSTFKSKKRFKRR